MDCWIITNKDENISAEKIFERLIKNQQIWDFPKDARNLERLKEEDRVIFRRKERFIATAIIKSKPFPLKKSKYEMVGYNETGQMIIELEDIHGFSNLDGILTNELSFVKNKDKYGAYYRGSIQYCPTNDCQTILQRNK
jgi:hypothetical protein